MISALLATDVSECGLSMLGFVVFLLGGVNQSVIVELRFLVGVVWSFELEPRASDPVAVEEIS